jgi:DNA-binding response OmpR family regulator
MEMRQHILVIEDDPGIRDLLTDTLTSGGYAVTTTDSALGAGTLVRRVVPRLIVLDLGLPYRSGGSLLHDLKADPATAKIPVLVVSALADSLSPERRALAAGVVPKPFSPDALLVAVDKACRTYGVMPQVVGTGRGSGSSEARLVGPAERLS